MRLLRPACSLRCDYSDAAAHSASALTPKTTYPLTHRSRGRLHCPQAARRITANFANVSVRSRPFYIGISLNWCIVFVGAFGGKSMASTDDVRLAAALSGGLGSFEFVFDDDDVVRLLRTAIEHEESQVAFAKHHGINRTYLNMVLTGKRPVGDAVAEALGLRKVYTAK
jgi:hypothetical protein